MANVPLPQDIAYQLAHSKDSKVPRILATGVVCPVIAYTAVILRFTARRISHAPLKADDWTILGSLIFTTLYAALQFVYLHAGLGRHVILATNVKLDVILGVSLECIYGVGLPVVKISYLLFLNRIFGFLDKRFARKLLYCGILIIVYSLVRIAVVAAQCVPLSIIWTPPGAVKGYCIKVKPALIVSGSINVLTDIYMFTLPIKKLWVLRVDSKQRFQLITVFLLGLFVCIISIIRIFQILKYTLADGNYNDVDLAIWSGIELSIATLGTCVPVMRPLFDHVIGRRSGSSFVPSSFLHASFLRNISFKSAPGVQQQSSSQRPTLWRPGRDDSLLTRDKGRSSISVEEGVAEVRTSTSESEPREDEITVKKEKDVVG